MNIFYTGSKHAAKYLMNSYFLSQEIIESILLDLLNSLTNKDINQ